MNFLVPNRFKPAMISSTVVAVVVVAVESSSPPLEFESKAIEAETEGLEKKREKRGPSFVRRWRGRH